MQNVTRIFINNRKRNPVIVFHFVWLYLLLLGNITNKNTFNVSFHSFLFRGRRKNILKNMYMLHVKYLASLNKKHKRETKRSEWKINRSEGMGAVITQSNAKWMKMNHMCCWMWQHTLKIRLWIYGIGFWLWFRWNVCVRNRREMCNSLHPKMQSILSFLVAAAAAADGI